MTTLYFATCTICEKEWVGNAYEKESQANDELLAHMHRHAEKGEEGGGQIESRTDALYWGSCNICNWVGNSHPESAKANAELNEHMRHHAAKGESGGGDVVSSEDAA